MPIRNLEKLFYPRAIVVVGASNRDGAAGHLVMQNLLHGGFEGPIMPVSAGEQAVAGVLAYPDIDRVPIAPDLAVIGGRQPNLPEMIENLARQGTRAAILVADNLSAPHDGCRREDLPAFQAARRYGLRLLGPDCLGVIVPGIGLNASIAPVTALPGGIAFVSQSSTISLGVLDWARERDIGFSYFISLGGGIDVEVSDVIDYLGNDPFTRAILLYMEDIRDGRSFMSAGRGASRNKPILVIKSGRTAEGRQTTFGDNRNRGSDAVFDAAIRRAGMLRVYGFGELFAAVETLGRAKPLKAERLALLANGRGIAALAVDSLLLDGGRLATLSENTAQALKGLLPEGWPRTNPVVLDGEAPPHRYAEAARMLFADREVDALMVLHAPVSAVSSDEVARAVISAVHEAKRPALVSWMGGSRVSEARRLFGEAGIPTYDTPTQAVAAFMHMVRYRRNQELLMETPDSVALEFAPATEAARIVLEDVLNRGETLLAGREAKAILAAYGIPTVESRMAATPEEAAAIANRMGYPVALKIASPDIPHKGEVGGVDLFLDTPDSVRTAAETMLSNVRARKPQAMVQGLTVERMVLRPGSHEVMIAVRQDPIFGPVIAFGHGGQAAAVIEDLAFALPPLNMSLARELVSRTRIFRLLQGYGDCPPANMELLYLTLVQVSQLIVEQPNISTLEINPLFVDQSGVFAVEASMEIISSDQVVERRLAIRPYPKELEEEYVLRDGRKVILRPIRPEDEPAHYEFLAKVTPEDIRLRFFHHIRTLPHTEMARLTQIDYDREMAFIAVLPKTDGHGPETLGVVRIITDPNNEKAEYAILVRSDLKGQKLGRKLMEKIIQYCRSRGTKKVKGLILSDNKRMLDLVHHLGFTSRRVPDDDVVEVTLSLDDT